MIRRQRFGSRGRQIDDQESLATIDERQESIFQSHRYLALADHVVENDLSLPHRMEMVTLNFLRESGVVQVEPRRPQLTTKEPTAEGTPLSTAEYFESLDHFVAKFRPQKVVVVQGGNQVAIQYLTDVHGLDVRPLKLSSIDKQPVGALLTTAMTPRERSILSEQSSGLASLSLLRAETPFTHGSSDDSNSDELKLCLDLMRTTDCH